MPGVEGKKGGTTILECTIGKQWYFNDIGERRHLPPLGRGNFLLSPPTPFFLELPGPFMIHSLKRNGKKSFQKKKKKKKETMLIELIT